MRIVNIEWVRDNLSGLVILDARPYVKYMMSGHIPGAVNAQVSKVMDVSTGAIKPVDTLNEVFAKWGLNEDSVVLIYDEYDGQLGARLAWTLEYCGKEVYVMREFFDEWARLSYPVSFKLEKPRGEGNLKCRPDESVRATYEYVLNSIGKGTIVDTRSPEEYHGLVGEFPVGGHIPTSLNIPWLQFVDQRGYRQLDPKLDRSREVIVYCDYGLRASIAYMALRNAGYRVRLYEKGFTEWSSLGLPVEK